MFLMMQVEATYDDELAPIMDIWVTMMAATAAAPDDILV